MSAVEFGKPLVCGGTLPPYDVMSALAKALDELDTEGAHADLLAAVRAAETATEMAATIDPLDAALKGLAPDGYVFGERRDRGEIEWGFWAEGEV